MPRPNGFSLFLTELRPTLRKKYASEEAFREEVGRQWDKLPHKVRQAYQARAKPASHLKKSLFDSFGRNLADVDAAIALNEQIKRDQRLAISKSVEARTPQEVEAALEKKFIVIYFNCFYHAAGDTETSVPAEIGLAKFSLKNGIVSTFCALVDPGSLPVSKSLDCCKEMRVHNIEASNIHDLGCEVVNREQLLSKIRAFCASDTGDARGAEIVQLFCYDWVSSMNANEGKSIASCLEWLGASRNEFQVADLGYLMFCMQQQFVKPFFAKGTSLFNEEEMKAFLQSNRLLALMDMEERCNFHARQDHHYKCALAVVKSRAWSVLDKMCKPFGIIMKSGSHTA